MIQLNDVSKSYYNPSNKSRTQVIRGIDLSIEKGDIASIIGPSGAGKTTLLKLIGGLIRATTGEIYVDEKPVHQMSEDELIIFYRKSVGFLYQTSSENLFQNLTVQDNILYSLDLIPELAREEKLKRTKEILDRMDIWHRKDHKPTELSGGEAQRAGLATAITQDPVVLLADEPTGEVDTRTKLEILGYMRELRDDLGLTILIVTHDVSIEQRTDYSYEISNGSIAKMRKFSEEPSGVILKEDLNVIDLRGMVKLPDEILAELNTRYVYFRKNEAGDIIIEPYREEDA